MITDGIPIFHTRDQGKLFVKERTLSLQDYFRFMNKLHWDAVSDRHDLMQALIEKDTQRLQRHIRKYIKSKSDKLQDCAVFMKTDVTVSEMTSMAYLVCYRVFAELEVKEVPKEE